MDSVVDSPEELEEAYLLLLDATESATLDVQTATSAVGQPYKIFSFVMVVYLLLDLLSTRVPGPGEWVGLDEHVQLFHRIASLF